MVTFRSGNPNQQPAARPSVAGERVARPNSAAQEFLEPSDSFDLGDEAPNAEKQAGEWLGRKAAAKSRKKREAAKPKTVERASSGDAPEEFVAGAEESKPRGTKRTRGARPARKGAVAKEKPKADRKKIVAVVGIALAAVIIACGAVAAFWAWDMWLRYDDAADIQGEWSTADGTAIVVIDSEAIHMPDSVDFDYVLNTNDKTISYSFDKLTGGGSYSFSDDRSTLTIIEADGSQTVFVKRSGDTQAEPRVVAGGSGAAVSSESAQSASQSEAASASSGSDAETASDAYADDSAVASGLSDEESAEVADALDSTSSESTPGANAVVPGSASLSSSLGA